MEIKPKGKIYSVNEGNSKYWTNYCKEYFESLKNPEDKEKSPYSARYIGSMVADVHRTLLYGGIFAYPADSKSPNGKLRLLYECFPMAFIIENAGGLSTDGENSILDIIPKQIHSRWPIFLGSKEDILSFIEIYKKNLQ